MKTIQPENCEECHKPFPDTSNNEKMICLYTKTGIGKGKLVCPKCYQELIDKNIKEEERLDEICKRNIKNKIVPV